MRNIILAAAAAAALAFGFWKQGHAQGTANCGPYEVVKQNLEEGFGEQRAALGIFDDKIMELTVGPDGSWSIILVTADGVACLVAYGENLETYAPVFGQEATY